MYKLFHHTQPLALSDQVNKQMAEENFQIKMGHYHPKRIEQIRSLRETLFLQGYLVPDLPIGKRLCASAYLTGRK